MVKRVQLDSNIRAKIAYQMAILCPWKDIIELQTIQIALPYGLYFMRDIADKITNEIQEEGSICNNSSTTASLLSAIMKQHYHSVFSEDFIPYRSLCYNYYSMSSLGNTTLLSNSIFTPVPFHSSTPKGSSQLDLFLEYSNGVPITKLTLLYKIREYGLRTINRIKSIFKTLLMKINLRQ